MNLGGKQTILDVLPELTDKRILMRVDYNVPLAGNPLAVTDKTRILATIPTLKKVLEQKPKCIVLMSHLGRPDGQVIAKYSLKPCVSVLEELIGQKVQFLNDCIGEEVEKTVESAKDGQIILLENLRFHIEEEGAGVKDGGKVKAKKEEIDAFREKLKKLGDVFVNDAFGTAHRAHSSTAGIELPIKVAGLLLAKEIQYFAKALESPERPLLVILGGAKIKDKIKLIMNILDIANELIIGGGMAFTFLKVLKGMKIGNSLFDEEGSKIVPEIMKKAEEKKVKIILPVDFVCGNKFAPDCQIKNFTLEEQGIEDGFAGYDIGERSIAINREAIASAKTVLWNGPQGVFEMEPFKSGSIAILEDLIKLTQNGVTTIAGGGDTVALIQKVPGAETKLSHVSTGGGASLELLEGTYLPGIKFLNEKK